MIGDRSPMRKFLITVIGQGMADGKCPEVVCLLPQARKIVG